MIDIENKIYTLVRNSIQSFNAEVGSVYTESPAKYPYVFFEMTNNSTYDRGSDSGDIENFAEQSFEVNIYTKGNSKKSTAKEIATAIDNVLKEKNFRRVFYSPVPNFRDNNIYRIILRYRIIVGKNQTLYNV